MEERKILIQQILDTYFPWAGHTISDDAQHVYIAGIGYVDYGIHTTLEGGNELDFSFIDGLAKVMGLTLEFLNVKLIVE